MNNKKNKDQTIIDFKSLRILLASKTDILDWSYGEVTKPETINYRTLRPEKDGLFDERIFGPTKDWECYCGKYKRIRYRGIVCDKCGVEVTLSRVRRERMGHITLATPVGHVWFFKSSSSALALILDMSQKNLESVMYYASHLIIDVDEKQREQALEAFTKSIEERRDKMRLDAKALEDSVSSDVEEKKKDAKAIKTPEQKEIIAQELEFLKRQKITSLSKQFEEESKKLDEIQDALLKLLKNLKVGSVLSEDEYYKLLDYDIPVFFTMKTKSVSEGE
jgi:DNA-directed RNA polymerase subunit beta'